MRCRRNISGGEKSPPDVDKEPYLFIEANALSRPVLSVQARVLSQLIFCERIKTVCNIARVEQSTFVALVRDTKHCW